KLKGFARAGVNRLSLGVQSFNDRDLVFLGREHSAQDAVRALDLAQEHFERYSFDLIYARPEQSVADWEAELSYALSFGASHMSLYQLTVEDGTPFAAQQARGAFKVPLEDKSAQFYNLTQDIMEAAGLGAYEVSNYAREWHKCRHNLVYWHMADYVGIGAGAHGRYILDGQKYATCAANKPQRWLSCVRERGVGYMGEPEALSASECFYESLLMGLRLTQGVSLARCEALSSVRSQDILDFSRIEIACEEGWLVYDKKRHHLSATREGILRLNALLGYIVR
ncbi:MAG: coproporphyrinogen-III oxidase family protein, partial [Alphaproteobacteria bacterium]